MAELRQAIRTGQLRPGHRVPSARELMREHGVAIATASKVLTELRREGLVRPVPGVGTVVRGTAREPEFSAARIVEAAISIADDEGSEAVSMRLLAKELGVSTMALYRHVKSREELLVLMADAALAEDNLPSRTAPWRKRLELAARMQWRGYRRHPWLPLLLSMTRPEPSASGMRHTEYVLDAIAELPFPQESQLREAVAFLAFIRGMAASIEAERFSEQDTGMSNEEWVHSRHENYVRLMPRYPNLLRVSMLPDVDMSLDALFECGLQTMLDGLELRARRRR
ncbi:MAG: TetR/AcrR family transcriptional regulator C-terminal domain-containing protein [Archangium sp.]